MAAIRNALWPFGLSFAIIAEAAGQPPLPALDATTGFALIALGLLARRARPQYAAGAMIAAAGFAWFLGTIAPPAVFFHRGPLAQLMLTYPATRPWPASWLERVAILGGYTYAVAYPIADSDTATIIFGLALVLVAVRRYQAGRGPDRRARASALVAASAFGLLLAAESAIRIAGVQSTSSLLAAYEVIVLLIVAGLFTDLLWGAWAQATMTALVVDLGEVDGAATLRDRLARTLADPTLAVAYWLDEQQGYVDGAGRPVALPAHNSGRGVLPIDDQDGRLAAVIHDLAVLDDPDLISGIITATRLAVANARLQADVRARVTQVEASRRRLLEAADEQRRSLELALRQGAERRLAHVAELLADCGPLLQEASAGLASARAGLRELAHGIHPATLTDAGLAAATHELAARSPIPVTLLASDKRWPAAVEAAAYFVCAEALANVAKYAHASSVLIQITSTDAELLVEVKDDGVGGADPGGGSGLRGLADRVETLGGELAVRSPGGAGTRIAARIPLQTTPAWRARSHRLPPGGTWDERESAR